MSTSTSKICRVWQPIPLIDIRFIALHFKLPNLDFLPDEVYLEIPRNNLEGDISALEKNGSTVFSEVGVALPELFFGLEQNGFPNVSLRGDWIQNDNPLGDRFNVHFCFVPFHERDIERAIRHDGQMAKKAFESLTQHRWNVSGFSNGGGNFDFTMHRPRNQSSGSVLAVDQDFLGLH